MVSPKRQARRERYYASLNGSRLGAPPPFEDQAASVAYWLARRAEIAAQHPAPPRVEPTPEPSVDLGALIFLLTLAGFMLVFVLPALVGR